MPQIIVIDTREQAPLSFAAYPTKTDTLPVGDYGLEGFSDWTNPAFIVERKSLADLVGSLTSGRDRFMKEVEKLRQFRFAAIVIEATESQVLNADYRSVTTPQSIIASLHAIQVRTGVHVIWAINPSHAAKTIENLIRQFIRGIEKQAKLLALDGRQAAQDGPESQNDARSESLYPKGL